MANEMLAAALSYAEKGWPIFPCGADKRPLSPNGVIDATTNPEAIRAFWTRHPGANIGLNVGAANLLVVDLDRYKPGFEAPAPELIPATPLRAVSPRGGEHLYYALNDGEVVSSSASRLGRGVDVRSFHGYVLLPPSRTADGEYRWVSEGKPAFRTDALVAHAHREKSATRDVWIIDPDMPEHVEQAKAWLRNEAKPAIDGQGGDHMAIATAAMMKSFGLSEAMALELMWDHWNPRCEPPWSADEYEHFERKVQNGYRYSSSDPGNITAAWKQAKAKELFKPVERELPSGREATAGRFRFVDRQGMAHIKPASWLIKDFLPSGAYAMLVAPPGSFKTFLALDLALTVATGYPEEAIWTAEETGPVLYAAGEGRSSMANRVAAWERLHWGGRMAEGFVLADPVPNVMEDWAPFIEGALRLSPDGYKLVVIDTVGRALAGADENAQEFASKLTQKVEQLQAELGCAVLALHHTSEGGQGRPRGSGVFRGDIDTLASVTRIEKEMVVSVALTKQKDAEEWVRPRRIGLQMVELAEGVRSLAAVKAPAGSSAETPTPNPAQKKPGKALDGAAVLVLDAAVKAILSSNHLLAWNTKDLAAAVAMREEIDVDSRSLQNTLLARLRETTGTYASKVYDVHSKRWRHQEG